MCDNISSHPSHPRIFSLPHLSHLKYRLSLTKKDFKMKPKLKKFPPNHQNGTPFSFKSYALLFVISFFLRISWFSYWMSMCMCHVCTWAVRFFHSLHFFAFYFHIYFIVGISIKLVSLSKCTDCSIAQCMPNIFCSIEKRFDVSVGLSFFFLCCFAW